MYHSDALPFGGNRSEQITTSSEDAIEGPPKHLTLRHWHHKRVSASYLAGLIVESLGLRRLEDLLLGPHCWTPSYIKFVSPNFVLACRNVTVVGKSSTSSTALYVTHGRNQMERIDRSMNEWLIHRSINPLVPEFIQKLLRFTGCHRFEDARHEWVNQSSTQPIVSTKPLKCAVVRHHKSQNYIKRLPPEC